ncbi:MAG: adenosyl-hopene transferase HpnH [Planctomycetes bacterium]|nr:adenosyl-hopene transferase HpnH [Planctomycetota bacterium]
MSVPFSQMWTVASYVMGRQLRGVKRYPLVLMLEPLFRCNLACAGCGKIQHPGEVLRDELSPEACFKAVDECEAPIVSIPGGEPLLHSRIAEIVNGLVARKKYVYLCTNALKLEESLEQFTPSKFLAFSVHMDGPREEHDQAVCREGVFDDAVRAITAAKQRGFRVTTNTTLYAGMDANRIRVLFDQMMDLGVEGMMISPGYSYSKAPDQDHFLARQQTVSLFRAILAGSKRRWQFNQTPLFLQFLQGNVDLECTPWGNPTYNLFGWQRPCYLLDEGYCESFDELMATTAWHEYGRASGNDKCQDCMVHCGYEPSAVAATFGSWQGFLRTIQLQLGVPLRPQNLRELPPPDVPPESPSAAPVGSSNRRVRLPVLK